MKKQNIIFICIYKLYFTVPTKTQLSNFLGTPGEDYFKGNPKSLNFYFLVIWWGKIIYIYIHKLIQVFLLGVPCGRFIDCPEWSPQEHPIELAKAESSDFGVSHFVCLGMFPLKKSRFFWKKKGWRYWDDLKRTVCKKNNVFFICHDFVAIFGRSHQMQLHELSSRTARRPFCMCENPCFFFGSLP